MNTFFDWLNSDSWHAWVLALFHSLWLGGLWASILWLFLRKIPTRFTKLRYAIALASQMLLLVSVLTARNVHMRLTQHESQVLINDSQILSTEASSTISPKQDNSLAIPANGTSNGSNREAFISNNHQWAAYLALLWGMGAMIMGMRLVRQILGLRRLRSSWIPLDSSEIQAIIDRTVARLNLRLSFRVFTGEGLNSPAVFGLFYPTLLLPASLITGTPIPQLTAIIAHELAHIRRFDYAVNLLQCFIEILLFFNPAVWWINQQIRIEREACCDAIAVGVAGCERDYADTLLKVLMLSRAGTASISVAPGMSGNSHHFTLLDRCRRILDPGYQPILRLPWYSLVSTVLLTAVMFLGLWQGTQVAVAFAADLIAPVDRIKRMAEIDKTNNPPHRFSSNSSEKDKITIKGRIRTMNGAPLPENVVVHIVSKNQNYSAGYSVSVNGGIFEYPVQLGKIYVGVDAPGYAPLFVGPLTNMNIGKPSVPAVAEGDKTQSAENLLPELDLVLNSGFEANIRTIDSLGNGVPGVVIKGSYQHPASMGNSFEAVTDDAGFAKISHAINISIKLSFTKDGFQYEEKENAVLSSGQPVVWTLKSAKISSGQVVSIKTGKPVPGVEILLLAREGVLPMTHMQKEYAPVLATTDSQGRFNLSNLNHSATHVLWISSSNEFAIVRNVKAGQKDLKIELVPKISVHGIIQGDLSQLGESPWTVSYSPIHVLGKRRDQTHENVSKRIPVVEKKDNEAFFDIENLDVEFVRINAGNKSIRVELKEEHQAVVIKLESPPTSISQSNHTREVVVKFDVPAGIPGPRGWLSYTFVPKGAVHTRQQSVEIRRREARFDVEAPGTLSYYPKETIGYWFQEKWGIDVPAGEEPLIINVLVTPAGAIHGSVVNADGSDASNVFVSIVPVEKPAIVTGSLGVEGKNSASPNDGPTLFSIQPLPLNGKYMVVAHRSQCFVTSDLIELTEQNPIHQLTLKMANGIPLECIVFDENKKPKPGIPVGLGFGTSYGHGFSNDQLKTTDEKGLCVFPGVNPDAKGSYGLEISDLPGYRPVRQKVDLSKRPVPIYLEKAEILLVKAVHYETQKPITEASFYLLPTDFSVPETTGYLNSELNSNPKGEYRFSNLARRKYSLHLRDGTIVNGSVQTIDIAGGKDTNVVVRVRPPAPFGSGAK